MYLILSCEKIARWSAKRYDSIYIIKFFGVSYIYKDFIFLAAKHINLIKSE